MIGGVQSLEEAVQVDPRSSGAFRSSAAPSERVRRLRPSGQATLREALSKLRKRYDLILLDTAPASTSTDAAQIGDWRTPSSWSCAGARRPRRPSPRPSGSSPSAGSRCSGRDPQPVSPRAAEHTTRRCASPPNGLPRSRPADVRRDRAWPGHWPCEGSVEATAHEGNTRPG